MAEEKVESKMEQSAVEPRTSRKAGWDRVQYGR